MPSLAKHDSVRARRNKASTATELVVRDPDEYEVPEPPPNFEYIKVKDEDGETVEKRVEKEWHQQALETWAEAHTSPMSDEWIRGDYGALRHLMLIEQAVWEAAERGKTTGLATLTAEATRLRKQLGLTPMGRRSLHVKIIQVREGAARIAGMRMPPKAIEATCEELSGPPEPSVSLDALYD